MRTFLLAASIVVLGAAALNLVGCGAKHEEAAHAEGKHGHDHDQEAPSGASFKPGKGVMLTDDTRGSLGVETADVAQRKLPLEIRFTAQVFGEEHKTTPTEIHHAECTAKAAGLLAQDKVGLVHAGAPTVLATKAGETLCGVVLGVNKALAIGDVEVIVGITNSAARLKPGEFLSASIALPTEQAVTVVPMSAILRTAEGAFVYTLNGEAYFRTAVKTGGEAEGFVEITDGLFRGDAVVVKPVEKLWLIELRATRGGGHSH